MPDCIKNNRSKFVAIFADQDVGYEVVQYTLENHHTDIKCVITTANNDISRLAKSFGCNTYLIGEINEQNATDVFHLVEYIFLAWWPKIIPEYLIRSPMTGVINFHPSLLPYNRGKNYNFWTIVENTPFGVSLHFVDSGIDSGDILFQSRIYKEWEDTGETLYLKAKKAIVDLFKKHYLDIINSQYDRTPQNLEIGTFHTFKELDVASEIHLDKSYQARELLNLLRARTFKGKPSCFFTDNNKKYEVRIAITEVSDEPTR